MNGYKSVSEDEECIEVKWTLSGREILETSFSGDDLLGDGSAAAAASFGVLETSFSDGLEF